MKNPKIVRFPNTAEGVKNYLTALELINTMPEGFNRPVRKSHAKLMANSVKMYGVTRTMIVINTRCFNGELNSYSGDGQHLRSGILNYLNPNEVSGNLSIAYYDMKDRGEIIPFISLLNSTAKSWNIAEFLKSWASHGLEQYEFILNLHKKTRHSISKLIEIYTFKRAGKNMTEFRTGTLKINKTLGDSVLKNYDNAVSVGLYKSNPSFLAFTRIVVDYKITNFTKILNIINEEKTGIFDTKLTRDEYLTRFRELLNFPDVKMDKKVKIQLKKVV